LTPQTNTNLWVDFVLTRTFSVNFEKSHSSKECSKLNTFSCELLVVWATKNKMHLLFAHFFRFLAKADLTSHVLLHTSFYFSKTTKWGTPLSKTPPASDCACLTWSKSSNLHWKNYHGRMIDFTLTPINIGQSRKTLRVKIW
jgi:hypothetical protein